LAFLAFVLAMGLVEMTLPKFGAFVGKDLTSQRHIAHLIFAPGLVAAIGVLAGCYPAFFLSAFEPVSVLKGYVKTGLRGGLIRRGLVVFQFAMSILLMIGTMMVYRQLSYMQNKKLGFDTEFVVNLPIFEASGWSREEKEKRYKTVKQAFQAHPNVLNTTAGRRCRIRLRRCGMSEARSAGRKTFNRLLSTKQDKLKLIFLYNRLAKFLEQQLECHLLAVECVAKKLTGER